ncbi:MAG: riboflavin biosynthesis protein RibF [Clostridia bacterium]|nr:riboflavin biosynthesis protein RibF [Clostridia bacterium]
MSKIAIALGMFDSVHIGHKAVIDGVLNRGLRSAVITFDKLPHKTGGLVLSNEEKIERLLATGVDTVEILNFDEVKELSPKAFLDMLTDGGSVARIASGFNFRFGKNAVGDTEFIRNYCKEKNLEYFEADEVDFDGVTVSTTYIKKLLFEGNIALANELLSAPFGFNATVVKGDRRGNSMGFPTINQIYPEHKAALKHGVYHTKVTIGLKTFHGVTDVGTRPTFERDIVCAETYIIGFSGNCYGKDVRVEFLEYLREEKKFDSVEELKAAIEENVKYVKEKSLAE